MANNPPKRQIMELTALLLAVFLAFSTVIGTAYPPTKESAPVKDAFAERNEPIYPASSLTLSAKAAALITSDGRLLFGKNQDEPMGMASTTKIMTGLLAAEYIGKVGLDAACLVSENAAGIEGSSVYLEVGERVRLLDLLYATLLASANDAATALAEAVGGSLEAFVTLMNRRAEAMGLSATHFENPHGLASEGHRTTAYELALLTATALEDPLFATVVGTRQYHFTTDRTARSFTNHNKLLASYEGAIGVKTGFTKATGRCLSSAVELDGVRLIAVTLSAPDDWADHRALLDFGFAHTVKLTLAEVGAHRYSLPTPSGTLTVTNREALTVVLPDTHDEITCRVEVPRFAFSEEDAGICRVLFYEKGKIIALLPLFPEG